MDEIRELLIRRMYATHKAEYHLRIDAMLTRFIESNTDPDFKRKCFSMRSQHRSRYRKYHALDRQLLKQIEDKYHAQK